MKYEQENLLEKFIQNEKRSKLWALLAVIAFILVSGTVVYMAKAIKGNSRYNGIKDTITVIQHDTVKVETADPNTQAQIILLQDSISITEIKNSILVDSISHLLDICRYGQGNVAPVPEPEPTKKPPNRNLIKKLPAKRKDHPGVIK